jgi:peroxiredoxin
MEKVSKRAAFVVDAEGVVRYAEVCATPGDLPNFAAIQETLAGLA